MKRRSSEIRPATRLVAVVSVLVWLMAVAHCTADCLGQTARAKALSLPRRVVTNPPAHQSSRPGQDQDDDDFCDSLHSVCPIIPGVNVARPDYGSGTPWNPLAHQPPLVVAPAQPQRLRQIRDGQWVFVPEVCLGPAVQSLAPPVSSLS